MLKEFGLARSADRGYASLGKSKFGFLILKKKKRFYVFLLNRLILDHSDNSAWKEPKNSYSEWIIWFL